MDKLSFKLFDGDYQFAGSSFHAKPFMWKVTIILRENLEHGDV